MTGICDLERVGHLLDVRLVAGAVGDDPVRLVRRDQVDPPLRAPVVVPAAHEVGRLVLADQPADEVDQPADGVDRRAVVGASISGTPKKARKYIEAVSRSIRAGCCWSRAASCHGVATRLAAVTRHRPGGDRPQDPGAAGGRRPDVLHRPRQGDRPLHLRGAPAREAARAARPDPRLRRDGQPRRDRAAADGVHLDHPDRPLPARRLPRAASATSRDRVVLVGRRRGVLHPQGPRRHPRATSRTSSPGSAPPPTSPPAPRSCSPRRTRTARSREDGGYVAVAVPRICGESGTPGAATPRKFTTRAGGHARPRRRLENPADPTGRALGLLEVAPRDADADPPGDLTDQLLATLLAA